MEKVLCFLCSENITNKTKVLSYFNFPDKAWSEAEKDWVKNFKELFNGVLCSKCAKTDLETAHEAILLQRKNYEDKIRELEEIIKKKTQKIIKFLGITISF